MIGLVNIFLINFLGIDGVGPILAMEIFKEFPHEDPVESLKNFKEWWSKAHSQVCLLIFLL